MTIIKMFKEEPTGVGINEIHRTRSSFTDSLNEVIYILAKRKGVENVIENSKA